MFLDIELLMKMKAEQGQTFVKELINEGFTLDNVSMIVDCIEGRDVLILSFVNGAVDYIEKIHARIIRNLENEKFFKECRIR